jgi:hypothetical protein
MNINILIGCIRLLLEVVARQPLESTRGALTQVSLQVILFGG